MELSELVVLLSDDGKPIGTAPKSSVHSSETPLHLAFSCHLFNEAGEVLVTRRALSKATWPGVWTNSFCGHPGVDESFEDTITRRAVRELGATVTAIEPILPDFRYRAVDASGVVENEVCPVFRATLVGEVNPSEDEVGEFAWVQPTALATAVKATPFAFSPWLVMQLAQWPGATEGAH
ncbi:isopentenyl-diphosphate Delta-isomerase [Homoserinimonas aerilata]|nr:isopentenyl-diphosphate Delta-isomerase [Homoserinimonas aerilata]